MLVQILSSFSSTTNLYRSDTDLHTCTHTHTHTEGKKGKLVLYKVRNDQSIPFSILCSLSLFPLYQSTECTHLCKAYSAVIQFCKAQSVVYTKHCPPCPRSAPQAFFVSTDKVCPQAFSVVKLAQWKECALQ